MKAAFISDIHGNAVALERVLADIEKKQVDKIVVLGDLAFRGPEPKRSLDLVRSLNAEVIKGNWDEWGVRGVRKGEVPDHVLEGMNKERKWTLSQLDEEDIQYLNDLPETLAVSVGDAKIRVFHATPESMFEVVRPGDPDDLLKEKMFKNESISIYGHIHLPFVRFIDGKILINTGSVGLPFDGIAKASYVIVEVDGGNIRTSIERVEFDVEKVVSLFEKGNYPNAPLLINMVRKASYGG